MNRYGEGVRYGEEERYQRDSETRCSIADITLDTNDPTECWLRTSVAVEIGYRL